MDEPDERPTDTPTTSRDQAEAEGQWMAQNWIAVAVVSILALLVLAVGMMQWTGLVDVFAPVADSETGQWAAFAVLAAIVVALAAWSWSSLVT